jgi:hypothetical protein
MALSRDSLLSAANNRKRMLVDVPELGGELYLQALSTAQVMEYNSTLVPYGKSVPPTVFAKAMARLLVFSVCDVEGNPLYTEEDIDALSFNDLGVLTKLRKHIIEISGLDLDVGQVADNLKKVQGVSSNTGLPKNSKRQSKKS